MVTSKINQRNFKETNLVYYISNFFVKELENVENSCGIGQTWDFNGQ